MNEVLIDCFKANGNSVNLIFFKTKVEVARYTVNQMDAGDH